MQRVMHNTKANAPMLHVQVVCWPQAKPGNKQITGHVPLEDLQLQWSPCSLNKQSHV